MFSKNAEYRNAHGGYVGFKCRRTNRAAMLLLTGMAVAASAAVAYARRAGDAAAPVPVVVELFTSEGCSSCPPMDTLLRKLDMIQPIKGVQVIGIEEHVDYWNQDGWIDPYSALEWTGRQEQYVMRFKDKTAYTPQIIVDGDKEMVNPSPRSVVNAIWQAAQQQNMQVSLQVGAADGKDAQQFHIRVTSAAGSAKQEKADVWLAVTEDGLRMDVTSGENKGRTLQHAAIVRSLEKIGTLSDKGDAQFTADPRVRFKSSWKKPNLSVVVFVQERKSLRILGAGSTRVSG
jgi:hypothetical protein